MNRNSGRPKIGYIHDFCVFGLKMVNKQKYYGVNDVNMARSCSIKILITDDISLMACWGEVS